PATGRRGEGRELELRERLGVRAREQHGRLPLLERVAGELAEALGVGLPGERVGVEHELDPGAAEAEGELEVLVAVAGEALVEPAGLLEHVPADRGVAGVEVAQREDVPGLGEPLEVAVELGREVGGRGRCASPARTGAAPTTQTRAAPAWWRAWLRRQAGAGSMSSSRTTSTVPRARPTAALQAAARPRRGPSTSVSAYGVRSAATAAAVPSVAPSTETITSNSPGGRSWRASAASARSTASRRSLVGMTTLIAGPAGALSGPLRRPRRAPRPPRRGRPRGARRRPRRCGARPPRHGRAGRGRAGGRARGAPAPSRPRARRRRPPRAAAARRRRAGDPRRRPAS